MNQSLSVPLDHGGSRLDVFLAETEPALSRSQWKALIRSEAVTVNGAACKPNHKIATGDIIEWTVPEESPGIVVPEEIPIGILYEDESVLVLNKQPGLVVHPAVGNETGTLVNALLFHDPIFSSLDRAGIVHRLDKDTSGAMVVAKTAAAMHELQRQFKMRETEKDYLALVWGDPPPGGRIETLLGRHPVHRQKMAVLKADGREAVSSYQTTERFDGVALVRIGIETGRTHQIRVHMAHIGHPIVGDTVYGRARTHKLIPLPGRQMLHACRLAFTHPGSGKRLSFDAPMFDDMRLLLEHLREK